jgi:ribosomal protein S18 acetylase RimI-like enzyme
VPTVEEPQEVTDELLAAVGRLVGQLSSSSPPPTRGQLEAILASPATTLLIARGGDTAAPVTDTAAAATDPTIAATETPEVLGMLTLAVFPIPTGVRAWIEDVVVDQSARGRGVGEALSRRALELAAAAGAKTVELTSRPSREAANRLYRRLGFQARETNVYRFHTAAP